MKDRRPRASRDMVSQSGVALRELLSDPLRSYNYADIDLLEGHRKFSRANTQPDISGKFSLRISLALPLVTAPMPDVTDAHIAVVAARNGALGIIPPLPDDEVIDMIRKVKKVESGFNTNPFTLSPYDLVERALTAPYSNIPVVDEEKVVGMLYGVKYAPHYYRPKAQHPVSHVMEKDLNRIAVSVEEIKGGGEREFAVAKEIMAARNIQALVVIRADQSLHSMVTMKDVDLREEYAHATRDHEGHLMVGAAVFEYFTPENLARIRLFIDEGANPIVIEQAHAWNEDMVKLARHIAAEYPHIDVVVGNDCVAQAAVTHWNAGAHGWKIGNGPGQACKTGEIDNVGLWRPQFSAGYDCANAMHEIAKRLNSEALPCNMDGGVRTAYDGFKALCAGGNSFMVGTMAAAAEDSPAESTGHGTKIYRAMGSPELAKKNAIAAGRYDPKKFLPEGGTNEIPITKKLEEVLNTVRAILMREFERVGALNQAQLHEKLRSGELRAQFAHNRQTR